VLAGRRPIFPVPKGVESVGGTDCAEAPKQRRQQEPQKRQSSNSHFPERLSFVTFLVSTLRLGRTTLHSDCAVKLMAVAITSVLIRLRTSLAISKKVS
jgi:hypothetical protein